MAEPKLVYYSKINKIRSFVLSLIVVGFIVMYGGIFTKNIPWLMGIFFTIGVLFLIFICIVFFWIFMFFIMAVAIVVQTCVITITILVSLVIYLHRNL